MLPRALAVALVLAAAGCLAPAAQEVALGAAGAAMPAPFTATAVYPGEYDTEKARVLERGPYDVLSQEQHLVPSDLDGAKIQIFVVRPDVPEGTRVPVILDAGPYFPAMTRGREIPEEQVMVENFVRHGYAYAWLSVRGTGDSGGCMDLMGPKERHDIDQGVTWLGTQPWSNGNVGMWGGSYDGSTQWEAASTGNPHLKTIVPVAAIPDIFEHQVWNGTASAWTPGFFQVAYWWLYGPVAYNPLWGRSEEHAASQVLCPDFVTGTLPGVESTLTGERDRAGWWAERDWKDEILANYDGSVLMIHGFYDVTVEPHNAYPFVNDLEAKGLVVKHVLGPWGHEAPWRADWPEILLRWYDRWLKEDATVDLGPKVLVQDNAFAWRAEAAWPPADAAPTTLYLAGGGKLTPEPSGGAPELVAPMIPVKDPDGLDRHNGGMKVYEFAAAEVCASCPSFATEPLAEELRFVGAPRVHLSVTPTGPGGHVTAILSALHDDGTRERVGFGQMDLRFADGGDAAKPVVPGQKILARLQLEPLDVVIPAGARLELVLHQGSYGVRIPSLPTYPVQVHVADGASTLTLDTIVRGPEAFHDAPPRIGPDSPPR